jgi:hypothetical protein
MMPAPEWTDDIEQPSMSRSGNTRSIERRVRRVATRLGLHLMIVQKPDNRVRAHGGYMLRDGHSMRILLGDKDYPYCADIDEVEAFLDAYQG